MKKAFLLRIDPELLVKLEKLAALERRSVTSSILYILDQKLQEVKSDAYEQ